MTPWTPSLLVRLELLRLRTLQPCGTCLACLDAKPEKCLRCIPRATVPR